MDLCGPQYYDGAGLATPAHITADIGNWVNLVGADKLCVGFGIGDAGDYMTIDGVRCHLEHGPGRAPGDPWRIRLERRDRRVERLGIG